MRLVDGFDEIDKLTETLLANAGEDEFKRQAGILGESVINPEQKAEAIAKSSFQNANFSDRIWMYQDQLRNEIANDLRSGLIQGKNSQEMARKLRRRFGVSMYNASRLARTEMARVQTEAQMQSFERNGYTHYVFIARESACDHCAPLDGKIFAVKDIRPGVNAPPIHPHCFCSIAAATTKQVQAKEWYNKNSGGISGAITDMYSDEANNAAEKDYGRIRKMKTDVSKISRNTGLSAETVQDIKDFVFLDRHNLGGKNERFAPDFAMSQSWIRLMNGNFEPHDLTLLKHEEYEKRLMSEGVSQEEAHIKASKKYNYQKEAREYYALLEKRQKRKRNP